jgi:hypothetical protein
MWACKPYFAALLVVFVSRGSGAAWCCWMLAFFDFGRVFRRLKTGLLAVADGGSAMAQETAQDMGLDQFQEAGEAAGGLVAEGVLTSDHAIMLMLISLFHYREKSTASPAGAQPVDRSESAQSSHLLTICHLLGRTASHLLHVKTRPR